MFVSLQIDVNFCLGSVMRNRGEVAFLLKIQLLQLCEYVRVYDFFSSSFQLSFCEKQASKFTRQTR